MNRKLCLRIIPSFFRMLRFSIIVVLKDGVVAEQGSPEYLDSFDSIYSHMKKQQLISENWTM